MITETKNIGRRFYKELFRMGLGVSTEIFNVPILNNIFLNNVCL